MARRISEIAKELSISSKAVIDKCLAEGVPQSVVKSHASVVPAGLEASIREWFATGQSSTAVENAEHPDVAKLRAGPQRRRARGRGDDTTSTAVAEPPGATESGNGQSSAEAPAEAAPGPFAPSAAPTPPTPSTPHTHAPTTPPTPVPPPTPPTPLITPTHAGPHAAATTAAATAAHSPAAPAHAAAAAPPAEAPAQDHADRAPATAHAQGAAPQRPSAEPAPSAPTRATSAGPRAIVAPARPAGPSQDQGPGARPRPVITPPVRPAAAAPVQPPAGSPSAASPPPSRPVIVGPRPVLRPPVMNVPTRPTVVAPAGQKLEVKQQIKLAGPKVVRIEAPEPVESRGPRRFGPGGGPGVGGGPGSGGAGVRGGRGPEDDRSKRNKRRTGPGGPAASTAATPRRKPAGTEDLPTGHAFSEQDLIEREERLAKSGGYLKQRRREARNRTGPGGERALSPAETGGKVRIAEPFTIKDLSEVTGVKAADIIKRLFLQGVMATINSGIDTAKAQEIMIDFDIELDVVPKQSAEQVVTLQFEKKEKLDVRSRAPVVTIMGHVDHGKTSLLDAIRKTNVAAGEAGGITQKTSAFRVPVEVAGETKHVVFLDTPGHEAFTAMRSRGATMTDIVVLVVGAPEGVMPQTVESINHAKAARVPIVVALNKIDSPQATDSQVQKIYGQLAEHGLSPVPWGGETELVKTSATKGVGITEMLEVLDLQAQVLELKADFGGAARGRVIEAGIAEGRGPVATILVQEGELHVGDFVVVGRAFGRVRDITNDRGERIAAAGPSMPVQISGMDQIPDAGDPFFITETLSQAEDAAEQRRHRDRQTALHQPKVTLDSLFSQMKDAEVKEILVVLKADVQGSVDVIKNQIEKLSSDEVKVRVLHAAVGGIVESDVILADASKAVIVGFSVIPTGKARALADERGVEIRTYQVIYDIVEDVKKAASGMLEPEIRQEILGHAEVRKVFKVSKVGTIAGCYITDGQVQRDALIRVTRNGVVVENDRVLDQLKRFKDDAKDVRAGMECGMKIVGYDDIKEGDVLECYKKVEIKRTL
ncbi:MAG: translation initiation factor IF-2 [Isosphaera sp.]|nr:translation initiation factor IF-2 [Isosphaera sp.]